MAGGNRTTSPPTRARHAIGRRSCTAPANIAYAGGALLWLADTLLRPEAGTFPTLGDAAYLLAYPLCLTGFLCLPWWAVSGTVRARVILDSIMVMIAAVTLSWFFILGPIVLHGEGCTLVKIIGLAYPLGDLIVISCLLLMASPLGGAGRSGMIILGLGMGPLILADSVFIYRTLHGTYQDGGWTELAWPLAHGIAALGMRVLRSARSVAPTAPTSSDHPIPSTNQASRLWPQLLPYSLLPAVVGLLAYTSTRPGDGTLEWGVIIGAAALLIVILCRQVIALLENGRLQRATASYAQRLEQLNVGGAT